MFDFLTFVQPFEHSPLAITLPSIVPNVLLSNYEVGVHPFLLFFQPPLPPFQHNHN